MAEEESKYGGSGDDGTPPWTAPVDGGKAGDEPAGLLTRLPGERRLLLGGAAGLVLVLFVALLVYLYAHQREAGAPIEVSAPDAAHREPPVEPGGMEVPDRDRLVYQRLKGTAGEEPERLAEGAEEPAGEASVPAAAGTHDSASKTGEAPQERGDGKAGAPGSAEPVGQEKPHEGGVATRTQDAASGAQAAVSGDGGLAGPWNVQIAAFQMRHRAEAFLAALPFDHPGLFKGLHSAIVPAERDGLRFWRIRFGPFASRPLARAKCREVRAQELNCIVVRVP